MTSDPTLPVENVQDYPRPPVVQTVPQRVRAVLGGHVVADTVRALRLLETHHPPTYYIPLEDVQAILTRGEGASFCEWKGRCTYWDLTIGDRVAGSAAWSYGAPSPGFSELRDHVAIYATAMDECRVGTALVRPQPGDFYGGWMTDNLTGTAKGGPGTRHW